MKVDSNRYRRMKFHVDGDRGPLLAAVYPGLYCPRCGSRNIALKMLAGENAIWDCWDCSADFKLEFPKQTRF